MYSTHPYAPTELIEAIIEYRKLSTLNSLFIQKYQSLLAADNRLHPNYNQCVRTGRMSCTDPNMQQLDKSAKKFIHPPEGCAFLSFDESQIEFRIIVHYINDERCIKAYNDNPDTDFHQWVADMAGISRKPAKTMNFMMGYGGGKAKAVKTLASNAEVIGDLKEASKGDKGAFELLAKARAEQIYNDYHVTLPTLKTTMRRAASICASRGYIRNLHGRRRYLSPEQSHRAFNSLCQGEAADIQKEVTVAVSKALRGTPIKMVANVHDATLFYGPIEVMKDPRVHAAIGYILEHPQIKLRVPLRVSMGYSEKNWAEADENSKALQYDPNSVNITDPFYFLR